MVNLHILSQNLNDYLETVYSTSSQNRPFNNTNSICILPGFILLNNLKMELSTKIANLSSQVELVTLDQFLKKVMEKARSDRFHVLGEDFQLEIIRDICTEILNGKILVSDPLYSLISKLDMENDDLLLVFIEEYNEYLRACDCTTLHPQLMAATSTISSSYWQDRSRTILGLFEELDSLVDQHLASSSVKRYFSITGLTSDVATFFSSHGDNLWKKVFPEARNIFIDAFTVYDSIFLKLIVQMVENLSDVNLFIFGPEGTLDRLRIIMDSLSVDYNTDYSKALRAFNTSSTISEEKRSIQPTLTSFTSSTPSFHFHSLPDMNREIKKLSLLIRDLIFNKNVAPSRIIVAARTIAKYKSSVENIFGAYGIPFTIEARNPLAYTTSYRFLKATVDLLKKIESGEILQYNDLVDPLRLGFCLSESESSYYNIFPMSDRNFLYLEEKLSRMEKYAKEPTDLTLSFWKNQISRYNTFTFKVFKDYLSWIEQNVNPPSPSPDFYVSFLRTLLTNNIRYTRSNPIRSISGPAIQNERFKHFKLHPTHKTNIVLSNLSKIDPFLTYIQNKKDSALDWEAIARVVGEVVGGESFGIRHTDNNSILFVEAANIFYRDYDYLFLLGVQNDEFPRKFPDSYFLNKYLRNAINIYDSSFRDASPQNPYLFFVNPENDFIAEQAFFNEAIAGAKKEVHFLRTYLDTEGRRIEWSCFIDDYLEDPSDDQITSPSAEFLYLHDETPLEKVLPCLSKKEILQLYNWAKYRPNSNLPPKLTEHEFELISLYADPSIQTKELEDRISRFHDPIKTIQTPTNTSYLPTELLSRIVGSPYRIHELALIRNCPLQYYFYQFYFNWEKKDKITRDLPYFVNFKDPDPQFGIIPDVVKYRFRVDQMVHDYHNIIKEVSNRQDATKRVNSNFVRRKVSNSFYFNFYWSIFQNEVKKIHSENNQEIVRNWSIEDKSRVVLSEKDSIEAFLPEHRKDVITAKGGNTSTYTLPVFLPSKTRLLPSLIRFYGDDEKEPFFDIRLLLSTLKYDLKELLGVEYLEPFKGNSRGIYFEAPHLHLNGFLKAYPEEIWANPRPERARKKI